MYSTPVHMMSGRAAEGRAHIGADAASQAREVLSSLFLLKCSSIPGPSGIGPLRTGTRPGDSMFCLFLLA